ncbi:MAG: hypothetical protein IKO36_02115 [Bacteroidaceae bacterium]|nr:hypothetical protein [Bacteroidaceae bacterium]
MGRMFTVIPQDTFDGLQLEAGVLLTDFDPANPAVVDSAIVCATTGGISISATPEYTDLGEDVDNVPPNMKELKSDPKWTCQIATTGLGTSPEAIRLALGAADITASTGKIAPRSSLDQDDFADLWWVGDKADGGFVAAKLINALSTGGFSLQSSKDGKGNVALEFTGHVSIDEQDKMPIEFYSMDAPTVTYTAATLTSGFKYGVTYYTRSGAGTTENPYIYTQVAQNAEYDEDVTYYVKSYS